ncbi:MAG TPA: HAD-IB family phosphatase [Terriglobales bacterium]|jgi:HAD superfamily phosphoserine phosphatase-like hydrolase|nr:HAD-IB family phosphatase [Terriglobales bacterium]
MISRTHGSFDTPEKFIDAVVALKPQVAAFDCDGTLWFGDAGTKFFYWEIEEGLIPADVAQAIMRRYDQYLAGRISEEEMCGEMVQIHRGIEEKKIRQYVARFVRSNVMPQFFPEMRTLVGKLRREGCDIWAVSSTNNWVIEEAVKEVGIPAERVIAVRVEIENGIASDRLGEITSGAGKARALCRVLNQPLDVSFGNSIFDLEMLELARNPFPVNPNQDLLKIAVERGWRYYQPAVLKVSAPSA